MSDARMPTPPLEPPAAAATVDVSFVVPAHDEAALIADTVRAIHAAARACAIAYEVVVVDDASTDGTGAIAADGGARVLTVAHRQIAATRNAGGRAAHAARLVFVDADTRIDTVVLGAALRALDAGAVGGGAAVALTAPAPWHARLVAGLLVPVFRWARIAPGCFVFCTRDAFERTGGFDERWFAGEDVAFSRALAGIGRFVVLRERVRTSDRKLRTHGVLDHLRLLAAFLRRGRASLTSRDALEIWYGKRRHGPPR